MKLLFRQANDLAHPRWAVLALLASLVISLPGWMVRKTAVNSPFPAALAASTDIAPTLRLLEESGTVFESVARLVAPAVVYIEATHADAGGKSETEETGSGVLLRPRGAGRSLVVTNAHVVADAQPANVEVYLADGRLLHPVRILADEETDIALLDLGVEDLPAARIGNSDPVRVGQWVLAIGSPFGLAQSVTHGIISAKHRRQIGLPRSLRIKEFLQTDAPINPGNSGGPLLNLSGEVIGINTAIATKTGSSSGVGFAIPSSLVRWVAEELVAHGRVRRGYLGIEFPTMFTYEKAVALGLWNSRGALVSGVHQGTPAEEAGLRAGDVILALDGQAIEDEHHLINTVSQTPIGKQVALVVWRDRAKVTLPILIGSWDEFRDRLEQRERGRAEPAAP